MVCSMIATERLRDKTAEGFYFSPALSDEAGRPVLDNTVGVKLATLDETRLQAALTAREFSNGFLSCVGCPLWGRERRHLESTARRLINSLQPQLVFQTIPRPTGRGVSRLFQEVAYWLPLSSDFQTPRRQEIREALMVTLITNISVFFLTFQTHPANLALPITGVLVAANFLLNCYRRSVSNWMNRSLGRPIEKFGKELVIAGTMAALVYAVARWPEAAEALAKEGGRAVTQIPVAIATFWRLEWQTVLTYGLFFAFTSNGIYRWDQIRSTTPEGHDEVVKTLPVLFTLLLGTANPLLSWASTSRTIVYSTSWLQLNQGDAALIVFGAAGGVLWAQPQLLNSLPPWIEAFKKGWAQLASLGGTHDKN